MSTRTLISVEEYLASTYEPDCDYVDGRIEERNVGEGIHAWLQLRLGAYLLTHYGATGLEFYVELRVQVKPGSYRIPDICAVRGERVEGVLTRPPFLCIEALSPEDRMSRLEQRISDYLEMGVPYVWVVDPQTRQAYCATAAEGLREVKSGVLRTADPALEVPLAEIFR